LISSAAIILQGKNGRRKGLIYPEWLIEFRNKVSMQQRSNSLVQATL